MDESARAKRNRAALEFYHANRDRILARSRERRAERRARLEENNLAFPPVPPERAEYMRAYREANRERLNANHRAYMNSEKGKATKTKYNRANQEKLRAYHAARNADPTEKAKAKARHAKWYKSAANRKKASERASEWGKAHPEVVKKRRSEWGRANREKKNFYWHRYRARKLGNGGSHTLAERREKFAVLGNVCYYCGSDVKLTVDHDIPIARGGTDDIENILPACGPCNSRKKDRTAEEFLASLERRTERRTP